MATTDVKYKHTKIRQSVHLYPSSDIHQVELVDSAQVSRVDPPVLIDSGNSLLLVVEVAHHQVAPAHANLAGAVGAY